MHQSKITQNGTGLYEIVTIEDSTIVESIPLKRWKKWFTLPLVLCMAACVVAFLFGRVPVTFFGFFFASFIGVYYLIQYVIATDEEINQIVEFNRKTSEMHIFAYRLKVRKDDVKCVATRRVSSLNGKKLEDYGGVLVFSVIVELEGKLDCYDIIASGQTKSVENIACSFGCSTGIARVEL